MPRAPAKQITITNTEAFDRYRKIVEGDQRNRMAVDFNGDETMVSMLVVGAWGGRYSRRRRVLEGEPGWADPLQDGIAARLLMERNRGLDGAVKALPVWSDMTRSIVTMSLQNGFQIALADADAHAHGPSLRKLWAEAKQRRASDAEAWAHVLAWATRLPPAFAEDGERRRRKTPPLGAEQARLEQAVTWSETGDLDLPWQAEFAGSQWHVRLNDFPDAVMYTLIRDGKAIGDFHDWPACWARAGQPVEAPAAAAVAPAPAIAGDAAARWPERYAQGESEAVWAEMVSLGDDVRGKATLKPARAVATETMRRARRNIELLVPRLVSIGYRFFEPAAGPGLAGAAMAIGGPQGGVMNLGDALRGLSARDIGALPPQVRNTFAGLPGKLAAMIETLGQHNRASPQAAQAAQASAFVPAPPDAAAELARLARGGLVLPLSLAAWMTEVGRVDLAGAHSALCFTEEAAARGIYADPLSIIPMADDVGEEAGDWEKGDDAFELFIGFTAADKAILGATDEQIDGGYTIAIPSRAADAALEGSAGDQAFVAYLRRAFRYGGFPGWADQAKRPEKELRLLIESSAPI